MKIGNAAAVAIVSGGASGLGAACVRMIAEAGGRTVIADIDEPRARALAAELAASTGAAASIAVGTDVCSAASAEAAIAAALDRFGRLDIAIHCAGIAPPRRLLGKDGSPMPLDDFARVIGVNLTGAFNMSRVAAAAMARNPPDPESGERGVIINTASIAAFEGQIGQIAYAASKAGVAGMTLPMARDLARHAIRVMAIAPGIFDTPLLAGLPEEARASLAAGVPFPPLLGRPDQFASLAKHIIENAYLNGEVIRLDAALRMGPK
jgi:NAD(P)-dependent dehydrogenase (short-subunit alcohol dehydrogenase family)